MLNFYLKFSLTDFPFGSLQAIPVHQYFFLWEYNYFNHIVILCILRTIVFLLISLCFGVSAVWLSGSKLWIDVSRYTILCTLINDFGHKNKIRNSKWVKKRLVIKYYSQCITSSGIHRNSRKSKVKRSGVELPVLSITKKSHWKFFFKMSLREWWQKKKKVHI